MEKVFKEEQKILKCYSKELREDGTGYFEISRVTATEEGWIKIGSHRQLNYIFPKNVGVFTIIDIRLIDRTDTFIVNFKIADSIKCLEKTREKAQDANILIENFLEYIKSTLLSKGKEYATEESRFHNFELASQMKGNSLIDCLDGMQIKHKVSLRDMISDFEKDKLHPLSKWKEKLGDDIIYSILLYAMIEQKGFYKNDKNS